MKEQGIPVKLDVWQITSEFAIIEQYYDEVTVLFQFWDENKKEVLDKVGRLFFFRSVDHEILQIYALYV